MVDSSPGPRHRVAVIGGGFGGVNTAQALASAPVDVTLVDTWARAPASGRNRGHRVITVEQARDEVISDAALPARPPTQEARRPS